MTIAYRDLRVLVCTANLGNARPDEASIAALIPDNGCFTEVVNDPHYPLPTPAEQQALMEEIGFSRARSNMGGSSSNGRGAANENASGHENAPHISHTIPNLQDVNGVHTSTEPGDDYFDIIVLGLQEATFDVPADDPIVQIPVIQPMFRKAFGLTVGKGHGMVDSMMKSRDYTKDKANGIPEWLTSRDSKVIGELLNQRCPSYNFAVRYQRGEMRLEILTHRDLTVETLSVKAQNTGIGVNGIMSAANKGGIVAELLVDKSTRLTFCTAHLQAHEGKEKYTDRCRMTSAILEGTSALSPMAVDLALRSHVAFFLGDLNFRTELPNGADFSKEKHIQEVMKLVKKKKWRELNLADELFKALRDKDCLVSFKTLPCMFPPTFKVERNGGLDYKDQRRPSYTDRICWRTLQNMEEAVRPLAYEPITAFSTSDHKPVRGAFQIQLNERIEPRAPMSKRRMTMSVKDLFALSTHRMGGARDSKLHLFFSKIQCTLKKRAMAPEPYVVFVSYPHALLQQKVKRFQKITSKFKQKLADELTSPVNIPKLDAYGFPRTKRRKSTYTPEWRNETHITIETHAKDGQPLDLTGAILFMVVMDKAPTIEKSLLGIYPLNLAHLCMSTASDASRWSPQAQDRERSNWFKGAFASKRNLMPPQEPTDNRLLNMKQPLMKNGKQTGWISVSLNANWLTDNQAGHRRASASRPDNHRMRRATGEHSIAEGRLPTIPSDRSTSAPRPVGQHSSSPSPPRQSRGTKPRQHSPNPSPRPSLGTHSRQSSPTPSPRPSLGTNSRQYSPNPSPRPALGTNSRQHSPSPLPRPPLGTNSQQHSPNPSPRPREGQAGKKMVR